MSQQGTVARSPKDIVAFFYLQRLEDVLRAGKAYNAASENSGSRATNRRLWSASLKDLLILCRPRMVARKNGHNAQEIDKMITDDKLMEATEELVGYLEKDLKLTDIAKVAEYDRTNVIHSNKIKGYKG